MPAKRCPNCDGPASECGGKTFVSQYRCPGNLEHRTQHAPIEWEGTWCCACNDKCEVCNAEIEPYEYEELEPEPESQASKHADAGYMNDMRFGEGDGPDW